MTCSRDLDMRHPGFAGRERDRIRFASCCPRLCCLVLAAAATWPGAVRAADPKVTFLRCELPWDFGERQYANVNGDGLVDLLAIADDGLHVFLQDREKGFTTQRQITYPTGKKACVFWPAKIGPAQPPRY